MTVHALLLVGPTVLGLLLATVLPVTGRRTGKDLLLAD